MRGYDVRIFQGYREDDGLTLESDVDEQLLIYLPFNQVVKLHSIIFKGPKDSGESRHAQVERNKRVLSPLLSVSLLILSRCWSNWSRIW